MMKSMLFLTVLLVVGMVMVSTYAYPEPNPGSLRGAYINCDLSYECPEGLHCQGGYCF